MAKIKMRVQMHKSTVDDIVLALRKAACRTMEVDVRDDLVTSHRMPFDIGTLQDDETFVVMGYGKEIRATLMHGTPYARYQYYGISIKGNALNYQTVNNPHAGSHWLAPYLDGVFIGQAFADNLKKEGGNVIT